MFVVALEIFQEVIRYEGWKQNLMSSGHQKPCVVLRLGSPFLLGWLAVSDDSLSNARGRVVLSGYYRAFIYQVVSQGPQF